MGKYKGLLEDIKERQSGDTQPEAAPPPSPAPLPSASEVQKPVTEKRKPGRPRSGKSSNPAYVQTTAYVEETVHIAVKKALLDLRDTDYSSLVNELLKDWIKSRS